MKGVYTTFGAVKYMDKKKENMLRVNNQQNVFKITLLALHSRHIPVHRKKIKTSYVK